MDHLTEGRGSGSIALEVLDPIQIKEGMEYHIKFSSEGQFPNYETSLYSIYVADGDSLKPLAEGIDAKNLGPEHPSPPIEGFVVTIYNDTLITVGSAGWLIGESNLRMVATPHTRFGSRALPWPADYEIHFFDSEADTSFNFKIPVPFQIYNVTDNYQAEFEIWDNDGSGDFSIGDGITIIEFVGSAYKFTYDISYDAPFMGQPIEPVAGDQYVLLTQRPFYEGDYFSIVSKSASTDNSKAKEEMSDIKVVPNPYIAGALWESRTIFGAGRGERKIDFIHLPPKCLIRIFTISGVLVKSIEHDSSVLDGSESWDLISDDGMEIAYGVYVYHVEAEEVGTKIGKFAVVK
jgi:hypothetical protein